MFLFYHILHKFKNNFTNKKVLGLTKTFTGGGGESCKEQTFLRRNSKKAFRASHMFSNSSQRQNKKVLGLTKTFTGGGGES